MDSFGSAAGGKFLPGERRQVAKAAGAIAI
jgi:hypothetical protein